MQVEGEVGEVVVVVVVVHGGQCGGCRRRQHASGRAAECACPRPPVSCELSNSVSRRVQGQKSRGGGRQGRVARGGEVARGGVSAGVVEGRGGEEAGAPSAGWPCVMVGERELVLAELRRQLRQLVRCHRAAPPRRQGKLGAAGQLPPAGI